MASRPLSHPSVTPGGDPARGRGWDKRKAGLETYFDRTARKAWEDLTSDAPVGRIRQTVRDGRDSMRATLRSWLPDDLSGKRLLDAGCGTGAFALAAARSGADVVAVDVAQGLVDIARDRAGGTHAIDWRAGDMLDPALGTFDHVVAMDSLIHYAADDLVAALAALAGRTRHSILFTFAPQNALLATMLMAGRLFPRTNRSPAIQPVRQALLRDRLAALDGWQVGRDARIASGFYKSHALELVRRA